MTYALWLAEFLLESSGAFFAFRKRLPILSAYLAFSAISDAILFLIRNQHPAYGYGSWIQEAIQYAILLCLACQIAQKLMAERKGIGRAAATLGSAGGLLCTFIFDRGETWVNKFLDAEISASCLLAGAIVLAYIGRKKELEGEWRIVTLGLILLVAGNVLCACLSQSYPMALSLYPIPAIGSLLLWNWAVRPRWRLREFRMPLPARKPPTSVHPASVKSLDVGMRGQRWVN